MPSWFKGKGEQKAAGVAETVVELPPEFEQGKTKRSACRSCGREFLVDRLSKHEDICTDTKKNSRKPFESGKQRAINSDIPMDAVKTVARMKPTGPPKTTWKEKSRDVREGAKAGREYSREIKSAGKENKKKPAPARKNSGRKRSASKSRSKGRR